MGKDDYIKVKLIYIDKLISASKKLKDFLRKRKRGFKSRIGTLISSEMLMHWKI